MISYSPLIKNEEIVKGELLNYVNKDDLGSQEKFSNALNRMDTEKIIQVLKTLNEQQQKKRGISISRYVVCLVWIRITIISCRLFVSAEYSQSYRESPCSPLLG